MSVPKEVMRAAVRDAMVRTAQGDIVGRALAVVTIASYGEAALYTAARAWAKGAASAMFPPDDATPGVAGFKVFRPNGQVVEPESMPASIQPVTWAMRFISATRNNDTSTCIALFQALDDEQLGDGIAALLDVAVAAMVAAAEKP